MLDEIHSLASAVQASDTDLLELARLVAGDSPISSIDDLSPDGLAEVAAMLRLYGQMPDTIERVLSYYDHF